MSPVRSILLRKERKKAERKKRRKARRLISPKPNHGLSGRAPFKKWFSAKDVRRLDFARRSSIGSGGFGRVYAGKVFFNNGVVQKVAVKVFRDKLTDQQAFLYQQVISDLARAGIPFPKMSMIKWKNPKTKKGEWVQVSQFFGKAVGKELFFDLIYGANDAELIGLADLFSRFINVGYVMPHDCLEGIRTKKGIEFLPLDIDRIVKEIEEGRSLVNQLYTFVSLVNQISTFISIAKSRAHIDKYNGNKMCSFMNAVLERVQNPMLKKEIREKIVPII